MSDLRTDLERLGERAAPKTDAFERLERRRRRKERNRRIGAGVLALVLVVGGSLAALGAFRDTESHRTIGNDTDPDETVVIDEGFHALWPEWTLEEAEAAQARVEDGEMTWRGEPSEVVSRFAASVLGWSDLRLGETRISPGDTQITELEGASAEEAVFTAELCQIDGSCDPLMARILVTVREVLPGLWSVVQVEGNGLHSRLPVGAQVPDGGELLFDVLAPDGSRIPIGLWYGTMRCARGLGEELIVNDGVGSLQLSLDDVVCNGVDDVPGLQEPTDGLLWLAVMEPSTADAPSLVEIDPGGRPDVGYVLDLAAVPVTFVPPGTSRTGGEVAEFTCDETGEIAPTSAVVVAQPDGVHIRVTNAGDRIVGFSIGDRFGASLEPGAAIEAAYPLVPGSVAIGCSVEDPSFGGVATSADLTIVDSNGLHVPSALECADGEAYGSAPAYPEGATGFTGDPLQVSRDHVSGLEYDMQVERAGYPESSDPIMRIVRDAVVIGRVTLFGDGKGGWLPSSIEGCSGTSFGWSEEISGVTGPLAEAAAACADLGLPPPPSDPNPGHGAVLRLLGQGLRFDTNCLVARRRQPLTLMFHNYDVGVPRNVSVYPMRECLAAAIADGTAPSCDPGEPIFEGEIIRGDDLTVYEFSLERGIYYFQDDVHPQASGALVVT